MSRTFKDKPRRVKARKNRDTGLCNACESTRKVVTFTYSLSAIFHAHEYKLSDELIALAKETGYEVETREISAYLGTWRDPYDYRNHRNRVAHGKLLELMDDSRALYSEPRGVFRSMIVNVHGFNEFHVAVTPARDKDHLFEITEHVSHKRNLFHVIEMTKEVSREQTNCDKHRAHYDFPREDCDCSQCNRDQQVILRRDFTVLKNRFNSDGFNELDESLSPLT